LISLLAINGLRISEALGANIDALGIERGHRTLTVLGKGGKIVTIPLAPRTARAIDLEIGERLDGPSSCVRTGSGWTGTAPAASCAESRAAPEWTSPSARTPCATHFITAAPDAGVPLRDVQEAASHADPRTTMRYDRARVSLDRHATYIVAAYLAGAAR
jgi:integrase